MPEVLADNPRAGPRGWLALLIILAVTAPALLVGIDVRLTTHTMENLAIVTSQESFLQLGDGLQDDWLIATNDGVPRLEKPPLAVWLNLLAWSDLDPASATPQQLIFRARCVTAALGLMMLASIFLIGRMLGDWRFAALASFSVASTLFFQRQARTASYDIHYVAWTALAVAMGLWAMNPMGAAPALARRIAGWGGCAVALAAAAMSKNPLPYLLALPPLIAAIVLLSDRRRADAAWLTIAALLSAAPVAAWYWHVFQTYPDFAERALSREVRQPRTHYQPLWYYLAVLLLVVPWTVWLIGSLIEPFRMERGRRRRAAMLAVCWFAFIFISLSIPAAKQQRYILGVLPAVGLLLAIFLRQHDERADGGKGRDDPLFRVLFAATWVVLTIASLASAWFLAAQGPFVAMSVHLGVDAKPVVAPLAWPAAAALALALLAICALGWRWHARHPWKSAMASGLWMLLLMTVFWRQEARQHSPRVQVFVDEAARIRAVVGEAPLRSFRWSRADRARQLNEEFRIYFGRLIRRVWPDEMDQWLSDARGDVFVLAQPDEARSAFLQQRGFERIDDVHVDRDDVEELWRRRTPR